MSVKSVLLVAVALSTTVSCAGDFNTKRPPAPKTTLGDDIYSVLCDRVGASVLPEDLSGTSYHDLCHVAPDGSYADKVNQDPAVLAPVSGVVATTKRALAVAKLEAMARHRKDLIEALNKTFDDGDVPIPFDPNGGTINGHAALSSFLQAIVPLYETNPVDPKSEPMMPGLTRSAGRLFAAFAGAGKSPYTDFAKTAQNPKQANQEMGAVASAAQKAMARMAARQGYRPVRVALGAIRPALAYPGLRELAQTLVPELGPGGSMHDQLQNVLGAVQHDLAAKIQVPNLTAYQVDSATLQPNRPRTDMEVARALLLAEDPAFEAVGAQPQYLARRDLGGFALLTPGHTYGGVDPIKEPPFVVPGFPRVRPPDPFGRALDGNGELIYQYIDTSQTFGASAMRDLAPLLDPDPAHKHETVTDLLAGAYKLFGDQTSATGSWGGTYQAFKGETSPLADLIYATGWMFADKDSDATLQMFKQLVTNHEQVVARVIGAALKVREISNQFPNVGLDPSDTFWDEMAQEVVKIAKDPALFKDVLRALENPDVQNYAGDAFGNYSAYRDLLTYDPNNINGAALNLSDTPPSHADPHNPVDYSLPDTGNARSEFHRILQIIHDVDGVNACNKQGAKVQMTLLGIPISWPLIGSYNECELFVFQNMGLIYLQAILGKAKMDIRASGLNDLINVGSLLGLNADQLLEKSSGITGMTRTPTPEAFNRLVFFGANGSKFDPMPDQDPYIGGKNGNTNKFVSGLIDPVSTSVCPTRPVNAGSPYGTIQLADCSLGGHKQDLLRIRDAGTIFTWEKFNFYKAMRPLLKAFDDHNADPLFLELMETLYRHWPTSKHSAAECTHTGTWIKGQPGYNPRYCAESGLSRYEPILAQAFKTDLLPALGELVKTIDGMTIQDPRNNTTHQGLDLLRYTTQVLFDPAYAAKVHLVDRINKSAATTWADGKTPKAQVTLFDLFAQAMREFDQKLNGDPRQKRWRSARSQIVDTFLSVDGTGTNATFHNKAVPKAIPILIDVLREQINANCPHRETAAIDPCNWGTTAHELPGETKKPITQAVVDTFNSPVFATTMDLIDKLNQDPKSRQELEKLLHYLLEQGSSNDALHSTMTSLSDMMQLLSDDQDMQPIYQAVSLAAAPADYTVPDPDCVPTPTQPCPQKPTPGTADRVLEALQTLSAEPNGQRNPYDQYRIMDRILKNLVTPMNSTDPESMTPIEVFIDTVADVNRVDADKTGDVPLTADDYAYVFGTVRDFLTSNTRGLEQFYEIIKHRHGN